MLYHLIFDQYIGLIISLIVFKQSTLCDQFTYRSDVFNLCIAAPWGVARVVEGSRAKSPETKINVGQV